MSLVVDCVGGDECPEHDDHEIYSWNYTHNTNRMLRLATGHGGHLAKIDGLTAAEAEPLIWDAINYLEYDENRAELDALEPPNGWGSREGICAVLAHMAAACVAAPLARFSGPRG